MTRKRFIALALSCVMAMGMMAGCGSTKEQEVAVEDVETTAEPETQQQSNYTYGTAEDPLRFSVEDVFYITGQGCSICGEVFSGTVKVGDEIVLGGMGHASLRTTVKRIIIDQKEVESATVCDRCGLLLDENVREGMAYSGQFAVTGGVYSTATKFKAKVDVLSTEDGGSEVPLEVNSTYSCTFGSREDINCVILDSDAGTSIKPGTSGVAMTIQLDKSMVMDPGHKFLIEDVENGGYIVGYATVVELLDPMSVGGGVEDAPLELSDLEIGSPDDDFNFVIGDVFTIVDQGITITGRVQAGTVKVGDEIDIVGEGKETIHTKVAGITAYGENLEEAKAGDNIGIQLEDSLDLVRGEDVAEGMNAVASGTSTEAE